MGFRVEWFRLTVSVLRFRLKGFRVEWFMPIRVSVSSVSRLRYDGLLGVQSASVCLRLVIIED